MPTYHYLHYDVFTGTPLSGNQLAVLPDARGLDAGTMQAIAREMNFSETTFVLPAEQAGTDARVRIFTPGGELPMAGHPTIGTTFALVREGRIAPHAASIVLGLGVGPTPVTLEWRQDVLVCAWMRQGRPAFGEVLSSGAVARALSLDASDAGPSGLPCQVVSCGVPFVMVPLASRAAVDRAELERAAWRAACANAGLGEQKVFLFAIETGAVPLSAYSRMFAPVLGVAEDPGTGSASGPLGAYLVEHGVSTGATHTLLSCQGVRMHRPCEIHIRITGTPGRIDEVLVGGGAVCVGAGSLWI
jgi:trans-2,3-dihydro-3-hydroxyanthranilate isomerase